ncbi:thermonuclease [Enterococcus termitis]|nr:thermonuclease [Enterococcus termitis]
MLLVFFSTGCSQVSKEIKDKVNFNNKTVQENKYSDLPKETKISVEVSRFIDGDTTEFIINDTSVVTRYLLIDTPETVKRGLDVQPFGKEASNRTKELLEQANIIELMIDKGNPTDMTDSKRLLSYVFVDGELLQDILVKEGLARVAVYDSNNVRFLSTLEKSAEIAKNNKVGIWSIDGYVTNHGYNYEKRN